MNTESNAPAEVAALKEALMAAYLRMQTVEESMNAIGEALLALIQRECPEKRDLHRNSHIIISDLRDMVHEAMNSINFDAEQFGCNHKSEGMAH